MTSPPHLQRFCPLCDRTFDDGEAVLRCQGCGVMHHPACWVTNGGCATQREHVSTPTAIAYSAAEGRARPSAAAANPAAAAEDDDAATPPQGAFDADIIGAGDGAPASAEPIIGAGPAVPRMAGQRGPASEPPPQAPRPPRRYTPPTGDRQQTTKPMPSIYGRHRILGYWYVPAAVLVAIGVALGVVWAAEQFTGDGTAAVTVAPTGTPTVASATATPPAPAATAAATPSPGASSPTAASPVGKFRTGDAVLVTGSAPDCLNVRVAPGRTNDAIICLKDGSEVTVTGGPETSGDLRWWKVKTTLGEGWAAEDYLVKK